MMLATLFIIFGLIALFHFIYQGIILPSIRQRLRYRLFELRDRLRTLNIRHKNDLQQEVFDYLQRSINNTIKYLHRIDLELIVTSRAIVKDKDVDEFIKKHNAMLDNCDIDEVRDIANEHLGI